MPLSALTNRADYVHGLSPWQRGESRSNRLVLAAAGGGRVADTFELMTNFVINEDSYKKGQCEYSFECHNFLRHIQYI
jgi:hypothetical protein